MSSGLLLARSLCVALALGACTVTVDRGGDEDEDEEGERDTDEPGETDPDPDYVPDYDASSCRGDFTWGDWTAEIVNGEVDDTVYIPAGRSVQLTAESEAGTYLMFTALEDPSGSVQYDYDDWWDSTELFSYAVFPLTNVSTLNWPVRAADGSRVDEGNWQVRLWVLDEDYDFVYDGRVTVNAYLNEDADLETGCLFVRVAYADDLDEDPDIVAAVEGALARWNQVYLAHGVKVIPVQTMGSSSSGDLPDPSDGHSTYASLSAQGEPAQLNLVVGETVEGSSSTLGVSGGAPGAMSPTESSAVVVSWLTHAGSDGAFDQDEVTAMGETMAHEAGHYLGLFHPVHFDEDEVVYTDALSDTPTCSTREGCEALLQTNLMYPYISCGPDECFQDNLTEEQAGVLHRYAGVL